MGVLASAPVLVAVAFLMAASLDGVEARLGAAGRDAVPRSVSRPLTEALARAVRGIVGIQTQRPMARGPSRPPMADRVATPPGPAWADMGAGPEPLREALLSLPPPRRRA